MTDNQQARRYVIQQYHRQEKTAYEVFKILKTAYDDATLSRAMVYRWYAAFMSSRESGKLKGGPVALHRKSTDTMVNTAAAIMQDDTRMTVRGLANILQIVIGSAHHLLAEILDLSSMCVCWIPRLLTVKLKSNTKAVTKKVRLKFVREDNSLYRLANTLE